MKKILVICGATASGKTALAVECAKRLGGEVISADALLVYRKLNIGTAKPTEEEKEGIVHHMIDVVSPTENFSVSDYESRALPILNGILSRGKTPVICGGTGFYINSLLYKSSFGETPASEEVRSRWEEYCRANGVQALHERLCEVDPESGEKLHPNDVKRVIRALEIFELTGKKKSEQKDLPLPRFPFQAFAFDYPREKLYERIDLRVDSMIANGLFEEVQSLLSSGVPEGAQCMQGIGYKEVIEGGKKGCSQTEIADLIKKNTRNYAKRQITFFKRMENLTWLAPTSLSEAATEVCSHYDD